MKYQEYTAAAQTIIAALTARTMTIAAARAEWRNATNEEPALRGAIDGYTTRTRATIITELERLIAWLAKFAPAATVDEIATAAGLFALWERIDQHNCRDLVNNLEYHYVAARNDEIAGGDAATAPQRLFGFNAGDTLCDVFRAVVGQAEEDLTALVEAAHAEALKEDRAFNSAWQSVARYIDVNPLTDAQRARALAAAHLEALEHDARRTAAAAVEHVPAADINDYPITTLHTAIDAEDGKPYAEKRVVRAYVARSISRALDSQQRHAEKYTAQDVTWLAEHNADHAFRNSVITAVEFTEIYHAIRKPEARPLAILAAIRDALLSGAPVLPAALSA